MEDIEDMAVDTDESMAVDMKEDMVAYLVEYFMYIIIIAVRRKFAY